MDELLQDRLGVQPVEKRIRNRKAADPGVGDVLLSAIEILISIVRKNKKKTEKKEKQKGKKLVRDLDEL